MRLPVPEWAKHRPPPGEGPKLRRPKAGDRAFGYHLEMTRRGAISAAVELFYGFGRADRDVIEERARVGRDGLLRCLEAQSTDAMRRGVATLHYVLAAELRACAGRHGYRAQGPETFFGVQHEEGEDGKRRYVRKERQKGLAQRLGVCVRTLYRWWRQLVQHGVWTTLLPRRDAPDAMLASKGTQVYRQRWLTAGTPAVVKELLPLVRRKRRPKRSEGGPMRVDQLADTRAIVDGWPLVYEHPGGPPVAPKLCVDDLPY